jgi:transposase
MTIDQRVRRLVVVRSNQGQKQENIARDLSLSLSTVGRIISRSRHGEPLAPARRRRKVYSYKMRDNHYQTLLRLLIRTPSLYQREMASVLYDACGRQYTERQIRRCLKTRKITRKKIQRMARERDQRLRTHFEQNVRPRFTAEQILSVDEVSKKQFEMLRPYGYAPSGQRAVDGEQARGRRNAVCGVGSFSIGGPQVNCTSVISLFHLFCL